MSPSDMHTLPHIVVVGGSFAGIEVCQKLEKSLSLNAKITLIEERDSFYLTVGAYRAITTVNGGSKLWVPYTNLFKNRSNHRVVQGSVTKVNEKCVVLKDSSTVPFDFLVIATGGRSPAVS
jgi:apoptosis-inducing factor 2